MLHEIFFSKDKERKILTKFISVVKPNPIKIV